MSQSIRDALRHRRGVARLLGTACVAAAAAACGGATAQTPAPTRTAASPTADVVHSAALSISIPPGWSNLTGDEASRRAIGLTGTVLVLAQHSPPGKFVANRNDVNTDVYVMPLPEGYIEPNEFPQYLQGIVSAANGAAIGPPRAVAIGSEQGLAVTYTNTVQGTPATHQAILVDHGIVTYELFVDSSQYAMTLLGGDVQRMLASIAWTA